MDKKKAICEYLRKNHIGKENAIHSKELEKLFLLDGRNIRRKISALRQDGFPICSDETGYYYADNQKEINTTVCRLNELVTKVSNARTGLLFASILGENAQTVEVTIKVVDPMAWSPPVLPMKMQSLATSCGMPSRTFMPRLPSLSWMT